MLIEVNLWRLFMASVIARRPMGQAASLRHSFTRFSQILNLWCVRVCVRVDTCEDVERFRQRHEMLKLNIALKSSEVALLLGLPPATEESVFLFKGLLPHHSAKLYVWDRMGHVYCLLSAQ